MGLISCVEKKLYQFYLLIAGCLTFSFLRKQESISMTAVLMSAISFFNISVPF